MEFVSGQKLTAQNLNNLVSLADGQNIPTDGMFIKSNGVNMWKPIEENPQTIKNYRIFDVQVRYHDIKDTGQEKGDDYEPDYKPFWYVYLGSDGSRIDQQFDEWDIKIEAGSGVDLFQPIFVYSQPMPLMGETLDNFEYNNAITQMRHCEIDETTGEVKNYKNFHAGKILINQPQVVNSDLNGWFCTGLPAFAILRPDGEMGLWPTELYATFMRTSNDIIGVDGDIFYSVLVFSNRPIVGLGSLKKNGQYRTILPDGNTIQYAEIMGGHSQKIGSFRLTADLKHKDYGVENTSMVPSDELSKEDHQWSIVKPTILDDNDVKAAQQLVNYQFINTRFVDTNGYTLKFDGNIGDYDIPSLNIYFSDLNAEDMPDSVVNAYYVDFSWTDDPEEGKQNELLEIKKLTEIRGTMSYMRDSLESIVALSQVKILQKNSKENPITYHKLIAVFLLNTNGIISPEAGQPIPWTIEHVSYLDTMPNFSTDLRYDFNLTTTDLNKNISPKQMSLQRTKIGTNIDGNPKETFVDQLYRFNEWDYTKHPNSPAIEPDVPNPDNKIQMVQRHMWKDGGVVNAAIEYKDIEDLGVQGDAEPIDKQSQESNGQKSIDKLKTLEDGTKVIQLYDFANPEITTVHTNIENNQQTYNLLYNTSDAVLVRDGATKTLKYKRLTLQTNLAGGETSGYTGSVDNVTRIYWDTNEYNIKAVGVTMSYENGLLKSVSEEKNLGIVNTVGFELS